MKRTRSLVVVVLSVILTFSGLGPTATGQSTPGKLTWWNMGDSYAAGEGTTGASGHCQQSANAFGPKAVSLLEAQKAVEIGDVFSACTGSISMDHFLSKSRQRTLKAQPPCKEAGSEIESRSQGAVPADNQSLSGWGKSKTNWPQSGRFDVITLSSGGNDMCFSDIVVDCLGITGDSVSSYVDLVTSMSPSGRCTVTEEQLLQRIESLFTNGIPRLTPKGPSNVGLPSLWEELADNYLKTDGVLIVVGYPRLFTPSSEWGAWRGDRCNTVYKDDVDMLGRMTEALDLRMKAEVAKIDAGRGKIRYVSRLELFDDSGNYHALCSRGVEWLNTVFLMLRDGTLRKERGFHPNDLGHTATAESVAGEVWGLVGQRFATAPATTLPNVQNVDTTPTPVPPLNPAISSGEQTYEVGSPFAAQCTVAWPTAPQIGTNSIQMRTSCADVASQFLFVDVVYGDPNLPVSPSNSTMYVKGKVADIVRSELGFTVLVVEASSVQVL
jgi:hypothetical protein